MSHVYSMLICAPGNVKTALRHLSIRDPKQRAAMSSHRLHFQEVKISHRGGTSPNPLLMLSVIASALESSIQRYNRTNDVG